MTQGAVSVRLLGEDAYFFYDAVAEPERERTVAVALGKFQAVCGYPGEAIFLFGHIPAGDFDGRADVMFRVIHLDGDVGQPVAFLLRGDLSCDRSEVVLLLFRFCFLIL